MAAGNHHESSSGHVAIELPSNRSFGTVFAVVFATYAAHLAFWDNIWWIASGVAALVFAVEGFRNASWLTPLNKLWMKVGLLLSVVVAPIALGILFFCVIAPIGLLARALGKDFLRVRRHADKSSYWIYREPPGPDARSMGRQF